MIFADAENARWTTIILVNSAPISTVEAPSADWTTCPAAPLSASRSVASPEPSVAFQTLPVLLPNLFHSLGG
jgi:hypothetical protein